MELTDLEDPNPELAFALQFQLPDFLIGENDSTEKLEKDDIPLVLEPRLLTGSSTFFPASLG